jgi:hypothetical protein
MSRLSMPVRNFKVARGRESDRPFLYLMQGCESGLDLDLVTLWIRIRIRIGNPDPGSGGKKIKKFHWKKALFSY